jgi:hypothetical protein
MEPIQIQKTDRKLKPLTQRTKEGILYSRPAEIEKQISQALTLLPDAVIIRAQISNSEDPGFLKEESLVYLILAYRNTNDWEVYNSLSDILVERCVRQYRSFFRGLDALRLAEAGDELLAQLFLRILKVEDSKGDYFQVRFWSGIKLLAISIFRKKVNDYKQEKNMVPLSDLAGDELEESDNGVDDQTPGTIQPLDPPSATASIEPAVLADEGLHSLKEPIRTAYLLYHWAGWQIESKDPLEPTISKHFNVTPKTIRNWLTKAEGDLKKWRGGTNE